VNENITKESEVKNSTKMSSKKGFELLKNLSTFFSDTNGFDKVMRGVSHGY
jgi:hypothetical protein